MESWPGIYKLLFLSLQKALLRAKLIDKLVYSIFILLVVFIIGAIVLALGTILSKILHGPIFAIVLGAITALIILIVLSAIEFIIRGQRIFSFALMPKEAVQRFVFVHHTIGLLLVQAYLVLPFLHGTSFVSNFFFGFMANCATFVLLAWFRLKLDFWPSCRDKAYSGGPRAFYAKILRDNQAFSTIMQCAKANPFGFDNIILLVFCLAGGAIASKHFKSAQLFIPSLQIILLAVSLSSYRFRANIIVRDFAFLRTPNQILINDYAVLVLMQFILLGFALCLVIIERKLEFVALHLGSFIVNSWLIWIWLLNLNRLGASLARANTGAIIIACCAMAVAFIPLGIIAAGYFAFDTYKKQSPEFWGKS